jgi:hypothetical protein
MSGGDEEKRAKRLRRRAEQLSDEAARVARRLSQPRPLLKEWWGEVDRVELWGRGDDGTRFIAELGPKTEVTIRALPQKRNPNRELLWMTKTWDGWTAQLVHYMDTGSIFLFLARGSHYAMRRLEEDDLRLLENAIKKARRRLKKRRDTPKHPKSISKTKITLSKS